MHTYLLAYFEKFIREELKQKETDHAETDTKYWAAAVITIQKQKNEFLDGISRLIFKAREGNEIEWRVQTYQQKVVKMLDDVTKMIGIAALPNAIHFEADPCYENALKATYCALSEMLNCIETDYVQYLDVNIKVPISYQFNAAQKMEQRLKIINKAYGKKEISKELLTITLLPFQEFLTNAPDGHVSYRHMSYLNTLLRELEELSTSNHIGANIDELIHTRLREMNFNHPRYFQYCIFKMSEELEKLAHKEQFEYLIWTLKLVEQVQQRPGALFNSLQENILQQLRTWINAEINFLKELSNLTGANLQSSDGGRWQGFKISTKFSVPQLGYALKLLTDTGFLHNENVTEMTDFFSDFFTSTKRENISAGSLRKHFYASDNSTVIAVRDILFTMINHSKKVSSKP